jgi:D-alanine-D-alanine ligase
VTEKKLRVAVIFGGRSGEHDVSLMSARGVLGAIDKEKYEVVPIAISRAGRWLPPGRAAALLADGAAAGADPGTAAGEGDARQADWPATALVADPRAGAMVTFGGADGAGGAGGAALLQRFDVVFPVLHGPFGEDGTVQGFLELANLPYVGAGVLGSALGMDKVKMKEMLRYHGLPVTDWVALRRWQWDEDRAAALAAAARFGFPCFVKPANLGSSVGVSKAHDAAELPGAIEAAFRHDAKILVEPGVDCREIEVAVLGNHHPESSVPGEIVPSNEFYDYHAKYLDGRSECLIPADVSPEQTARCRTLAVEAFLALECAGMARVDFFLDRATGELLVNEINTLPGFTPISMYPKLWQASGLSYSALIDRLIRLAVERWQERNEGGRATGAAPGWDAGPV